MKLKGKKKKKEKKSKWKTKNQEAEKARTLSKRREKIGKMSGREREFETRRSPASGSGVDNGIDMLGTGPQMAHHFWGLSYQRKF